MIYEIKLDSSKELDESSIVSLVVDEEGLYLEEGYSLLSLRNAMNAVQTYVVKNSDLKILGEVLNEKHNIDE